MATHRYSRYILLSVLCTLALHACIPDHNKQDDVTTSRDSTKQLQLYAQSFQQYANRSLNAFTSSEGWRMQSVAEGPIELGDTDYGRISAGTSEDYISSAYCQDTSGGQYHVTWFSAANADGAISLKGVGESNTGLIASALKQVIPSGVLAEFKGGRQLTFLETSDRETITLSNHCGTLDIPVGSVVAAYKLSLPGSVVTEEMTKSLVRTTACTAAGEVGTRTEKAKATYMSDGRIRVGTTYYDSELDILSDDDIAWAALTDCQTDSADITYTPSESTASAMSSEGMDTGSNIVNALINGLTNIPCRTVSLSEVDEGDHPGWSDDEVIVTGAYNTCSEGARFEQMSATTVSEGITTEEIIHYGCTITRSGTETVILSTNYTGIPAALNGRTGTLRRNAFSGILDHKKTTTTYEIRTGNGEVYQTESSKLVGDTIDCHATDTLRVTCGEIYSGDVSGTGPVYESDVSVTSWADASIPLPASEVQGSWSLRRNSMSCVVTESRTTTEECPGGADSGVITMEQYRETDPLTNPSQSADDHWGDWITTDITYDCTS